MLTVAGGIILAIIILMTARIWMPILFMLVCGVLGFLGIALFFGFVWLALAYIGGVS